MGDSGKVVKMVKDLASFAVLLHFHVFVVLHPHSQSFFFFLTHSSASATLKQLS